MNCDTSDTTIVRLQHSCSVNKSAIGIHQTGLYIYITVMKLYLSLHISPVTTYSSFF